MAIGSYAVCSVIALQSDDLISVRGHMTPASLIHTYIVGPIKKKPNKLNLNQKKRNDTDANYLSFLSKFVVIPQTLVPVVGAECPFLDQRLFDEAATGPESSIRQHAPQHLVFACQIHKITKHFRCLSAKKLANILKREIYTSCWSTS